GILHMNFADVEANPEFKVIALWPRLVAFCKLLLEINQRCTLCCRSATRDGGCQYGSAGREPHCRAQPSDARRERRQAYATWHSLWTTAGRTTNQLASRFGRLGHHPTRRRDLALC